MNPDSRAPLAANGQATVDAEHPWLGLASFTEETRRYFFGREDEVAELARRVQRKLLTVLFGQSGLGKTSMLRAGLVPRLRPEGYCPVYVRIDYGRDAPAPSAQIKQAIYRETSVSGAWTQAGVAVEGESLWEFLHHRDDVLRDSDGRTLTPLLIFDQFEEIFTLAQSDDFGRQRAAQFIEDLADLVENRPPKSLEARLDENDADVDRFDFTRSDYRILIALREDYLAHAEGLKAAMPSITQNRMRVARMTGAQALDAVLKPGGRLVSREVAEAIVRFVAGGSELANAEVEPSLLSLICRELNNARLAQGRAEISVDLLAGSHAGILSEFYERALADQPPALRRFIEEELLTDSGFRENIAEERVRKAFADAGATPDALARLVDRRLLRIEERLDVRRVELTHDVLCEVVRGSREQRHAREAQEVAERRLEEQRAREQAARLALTRARRIAAVCAVLALIAVAGGLYGTISAERAHVAEAEAKRTRAMAEQARGESERLILYLLDDFQRELEPVGRLTIVGELAKRAIDYYDGLPRELRTPETERNRALGLVRYGSVLRTQGNPAGAREALSEGIRVLDGLRDRGDSSESAAIGLALGLSRMALLTSDRAATGEAAKLAARAADVLEPHGRQENPSVAVRRAQGMVLNDLGYLQAGGEQPEAAAKTLEAALAAFRSVDGLESDADALARFGQAAGWLSSTYVLLARNEDARRIGLEGHRAATKVLETQPTNMAALRARGLASGGLAFLADQEYRPAENLRWSEAAERDWRAIAAIDPSNSIAWNNLANSGGAVAGILSVMGRYRDALAKLNSTEFERLADRMVLPSPILAYRSARAAFLAADLGQPQLSDEMLARGERHAARYLALRENDSFAAGLWRAEWDTIRLEVATARGEPDRTRRLAAGIVERTERLAPPTDTARVAQQRLLRRLHFTLGRIALYRGDHGASADHFAAAVRYAEGLPDRSVGERAVLARDRTWLAIALAKHGRADEARPHAERALAFHRQISAKKHEDMQAYEDLARALYAMGLASPSQARALFAEANALMAGLPADMRAARTTAFWQELIAADLRAQR